LTFVIFLGAKDGNQKVSTNLPWNTIPKRFYVWEISSLSPEKNLLRPLKKTGEEIFTGGLRLGTEEGAIEKVSGHRLQA